MPPTPFKQLIDATHEILLASPAEVENSITEEELDHWFTNTNYYELRFGDEMLECLKPEAGEDVRDAALESLRTFVADRVVKIERKNCEKLRDKFFPNEMAIPISFKNRKTDRKSAKDYVEQLGAKRDVAASVKAFWESYREFIDEDKFKALKYVGDEKKIPRGEMGAIDEEIAFYEDLRERFSEDPKKHPYEDSEERFPKSLPVAYRMLLPIWIVKELPTFFSLSIWSDKDKVETIAKAVCTGFLDHKDEFQGADIGKADCENYKRKTRMLAKELSELDQDDPHRYGEMSVPELFKKLYGGRIDPLYEHAEHVKPEFPPHVLCKAKLLWILIGGSIVGPSQAIESIDVHTLLANPENRVLSSYDDELVAGRGKAIFRRVLAPDEEPVSTPSLFEIDLGSGEPYEDTPAEGLKAVIGRGYKRIRKQTVSFSEGARKQNPRLFEMAKAALSEEPEIFESTDESKDTAWHLGVFLEGEPVRLYLVDLGSKNGTYVLRETASGTIAFAMKGQNTAKDKASMERDMRALGKDNATIEIRSFVDARRGDIIVLPSSQYEIL